MKTYDVSGYGIKSIPKMTVEIWNDCLDHPSETLTLDKIAIKLFTLKRPQRVVLGLPEIMTQFEVMLVPLDNDWQSTKMTGTDSNFTGVGITGYGFYAFNIKEHAIYEGGIHPNYIKEKLGISISSAIGIECLFRGLNEAYQLIKK